MKDIIERANLLEELVVFTDGACCRNGKEDAQASFRYLVWNRPSTKCEQRQSLFNIGRPIIPLKYWLPLKP